jgi:3-deoxy-D-manno-octulosonic-acid transferase
MARVAGCQFDSQRGMKDLVILTLYSFVMWCAQPFLRRKLARRGKAELGYLENIEERFGHYGRSEVPSGTLTKPLVWIHAVSLGETRAAAVLIATLRAHLPSMRLLLTHGTATGRAEGQKLLHEGDLQTWQAWDTSDATERFITHFKPSIGIMMETELWPNMAAVCAKHGIPLVIANARMSEKSYLLTKKFDWLARPAYQSIKAVWPQSAADADHFAKLGAPVAGIFGNLKFDAQVDTAQLAMGKNWRGKVNKPVVMFASSREGEELALLQYVQKKRSNLQWLIVPRHPQRFDEVATLIEKHGFNVSRRSDWVEAPTVVDDVGTSTIWLGNSLGEMALYYGMSDVALLGGSFEPLGGQNLIEATACGCPVVMGPSIFNFSEAAALAIQSGAALAVVSMPQAVDLACKLIENKDAVVAARAAAVQFSRSHQGAAEKTAAAVVQLLR